jgi:hypothetical protein
LLVLSDWHTPSQHVSLFAHRFPQPPQLFSLFFVLTHLPSQHVWLRLQVFLPEPQVFSLLFWLTHRPLVHFRVPQHCRAFLQVRPAFRHLDFFFLFFASATSCPASRPAITARNDRRLVAPAAARVRTSNRS